MKSELQIAYWNERARSPRGFVLIVNCINMLFQTLSMLNPESDFHFYLQVGYNLNCLLVLVMIVPSFWREDWIKYVRFGLMLCSLRQIVFLCDPAGKKETLKPKDWSLEVGGEILICSLLLSHHLQFFDNDQRGHLLFSTVFTHAIVFSLFAGIYGVNHLLDYHNSVLLISVMIAGLLMTLLLIKSEGVHNEYLNKMLKHISDQKFLKLVLDTHKDALVVLNQDGKIAFSNTIFASVFEHHITCAKEHVEPISNSIVSLSNASAMKNPDLDPEQRSLEQGASWILRLKHKLIRIKKRWSGRWMRKHERNHKLKEAEKAITDQFSHIQAFGETAEAQANFDSHFYDLPMFRRASEGEAAGPDAEQSEEISDYSLHQLLANPDLFKESVFELLPPIEFKARVDAANPFSTGATKQCFLRMELLKLSNMEQERLLLQIVDVSDTMLYDQFKEQNEMLSILNATVSHELRNPLNSIVGQNVQKEGLLRELSRLTKELPASCLELADRINSIIDQLHSSLVIQDSSAKMMSFLVQDFLDYAQIKSGKFRDSLTSFNVLDAVEKVMCIQRDKAREANIEFKLEAPQFDHQLPVPFGVNVITDQERMMQVLLNLQSNALKFTQTGSVTVKVEVLQASISSPRFLKISVIDTGIGIPYEDQDKLFKLFGFVQSTQQYNRNGIGLGLVISEKIVKKFGGQIDFTSVPFPEPNHGTTFSFSFKLEDEQVHRLRSETEHSKPYKVLNSVNLIFDYQEVSEDKKAEQDFTISRDESDRGLMPSNDCPLPFELSVPTPGMKFGTRESARKKWARPPPTENKLLSFEQALRPRQSASDLGLDQPKSKKILIVDDQIFNIKALKAILQYKLKIEEEAIDYALNGQQALSRVQKDAVSYQEYFQPEPNLKTFTPSLVPSSYALILMDCNMPFMDGFECSRRIRQYFSREFSVDVIQQPIISAVTGHAEEQYISKCFSHGMNQVLSKPIEIKPLISACQEAGLLDKQPAF